MKDSLTKFSVSLAMGVALFATCYVRAEIPSDKLDSIIQTLEGDNYNLRYEARMELQDFASQVSAPGNEAESLAVEGQILELLDDDLAPTTLAWLLRQLNTIGSANAVAPLQALLSDTRPEVADAARMALQGIAAPEATSALVAELAKATDPEIQAGLVDALAAQNDAAAVSTITPTLTSDDINLVNTAADSLSQLGGSNAKSALDDASPSPAIGTLLARIALSDDNEELTDIALNGSNRSARLAAFGRLCTLNPGKAAKTLASIRDKLPIGSKKDFYRLALTSGNARLAKPILKGLASEEPAVQSVILGTLSSKKFRSLESVVLEIAQSEDEQLQLQAIDALGRIGSIKSLDFLISSTESKSRDVREAAQESIAIVNDTRVDKKLLKDAQNGEEASRILAIEALSIRASKGAPELVTALAADASESDDIRAAAIQAIESIGTTDALPVLISLIVVSDNKKLRREAQKTMKRMSLRLADREGTWAAFSDGFATAETGSEAFMALLQIIDSAPTEEAIAFCEEQWKNGDEKTAKLVLKVLASWRNWDGGFALLEIATLAPDDPKTVDECFANVGRLILGSDYNYNFDEKFALTAAALEQATTPEQRRSVIEGFRYSTWRERVYVGNNQVDPELKTAVLEFAIN